MRRLKLSGHSVIRVWQDVGDMPTLDEPSNQNSHLTKYFTGLIWVLIAGIIVVLLLGMRWGRGIGWDEVEFFRATDWVRQGRIPYRDFWEHHFPLQWILMAPASALVKGWTGVAPLIWMRFAQLPFWGLGTWALWRLSEHMGAPRWVKGVCLAGLWASLSFSPYAIEYRQDTLSTCFYLMGIVLLETSADEDSTLGWWAGLLLGCTVGVNLRMAPPVLLTLALYLIGGPSLRSGRVRLQGGRALAAFLTFAAIGAMGLWLTGAWSGFWLETVVQNRLANGAPMAHLPIWRYLILPVLNQDLPTFVLLLGIGWAMVRSLRAIRTWGTSQRLALLILFQLVTLSAVKATYTYHLQVLLALGAALMAGEAGRLLAGRSASFHAKAQGWACAMLGYAIVNLTVFYNWGAQKRILIYQSEVLESLSQRVGPTQSVLDGCGYAFRNEPAFYYWFLPVHVRVLTIQGQWPAYTRARMESAPPAAVLLTGRVSAYFLAFPDLGNYFIHHYLPLYKNLWLPGLAGVLTPDHCVESWSVAVAGTYRLVESKTLAKHPWFQMNPLYFGIGNGPLAYVPPIDLGELPNETPCAVWTINGRRVDPASGPIQLKAGDTVRVEGKMKDRVVLLGVPIRENILFRKSQPSVGFDPELDSVSTPLIFGTINAF